MAKTQVHEIAHRHTRKHARMHRGSHAHNANKERMRTSSHTHMAEKDMGGGGGGVKTNLKAKAVIKEKEREFQICAAEKPLLVKILFDEWGLPSWLTGQ